MNQDVGGVGVGQDSDLAIFSGMIGGLPHHV
jgi:hypothetical protein